MTILRTLVASVIGAIAFAASAHAADMPGNWPVYEHKPAQVFRDMVSGWYIRGDIGYRFNRIGSVETSSPAAPVISSTIDNAITGGFGAGYKYQWFRADITADYGAPSKFRGTAPSAPSYYNMKVDAVSILANAYIDLGTWAGFTPYIGAGVGSSMVRASDQYTDPASAMAISTRTKWNFSWAAMGGVSYQMLPNIVIDAGYRYLKIGDSAAGDDPPTTTPYASIKGLSAHEVRLGFRFLLD